MSEDDSQKWFDDELDALYAVVEWIEGQPKDAQMRLVVYLFERYKQ